MLLRLALGFAIITTVFSLLGIHGIEPISFIGLISSCILSIISFAFYLNSFRGHTND